MYVQKISDVYNLPFLSFLSLKFLEGERELSVRCVRQGESLPLPALFFFLFSWVVSSGILSPWLIFSGGFCPPGVRSGGGCWFFSLFCCCMLVQIEDFLV